MKQARVAQHGTISRYSNNGCRCEECTAAWRTYTALRGMGRCRREPATAHATYFVREHARFLLRNGYSLPTLAARVDVDRNTIKKLVNGQTKRVAKVTADRIMGVCLIDAPRRGKRSLGRTPKWVEAA